MPRLGILTLQDAPFDVLRERWKLAEAAGFDFIYVADHSRDYRDPSGTWWDAPTALAALVATTARSRVGTLVANPILRPPAVTARWAHAVDHLSGGRLELGIGMGIAGFDHDAVGTDYWSPKERAARFEEYVTVVHGLLSSGATPFDFAGSHYRTAGVALRPATPQAPRPPITIGGQSPTALRVAAAFGECWNTHGPFGASIDEILRITTSQNRSLDDLCDAAGRDPAAVRRSLLLFESLDPWGAPGTLSRIVEQFTGAGVEEFVVFWPEGHQVRVFEREIASSLTHLRRG